MAKASAVKLVALLKRKPGTSMEEFEEHYENVHIPLVLRIAPHICHYIRNYIYHDSALANLDSLPSASCDVITEAWFETEEDFRKFNEDIARPEVRQLIIDDEMKFLDRAAHRMFLVKECGGKVYP